MRASTLLLVCLALFAVVNCYSFTAVGTVQVGSGAAWPATIKVDDSSNKIQIDYDFGVRELEIYDQQSRFQICPSSCKNYFLSNPFPNVAFRQGQQTGNKVNTAPSENGYVTTIWTTDGVPTKIQQTGDGYSRTFVITSFTLNVPTFGSAPASCQQVQCGQALDLMLVIDSSGSISPSDYIIEMDYAEQVINSFTLGQFGVHAGLVTFASNAILRSTLTYNRDALVNVIQTVTQQQGETNIGEAINTAAAEFASVRGRGGNVPKVMIVLTDGKANRPPSNPLSFMIDAANAAKASGILIYAIGVGSLVQQQDLNDIASSPVSDFTSLVSNFAALQSTISNILTQVCVGGQTDGCDPSCNSDTEFCGCGGCLCVGSDALSCGARGTWDAASCSCVCGGNWAQTGSGRTCSRCTITGCSNGGQLINNPATGECRCQCPTNYIGNTCQTCNFACTAPAVVDSCSGSTCKCPTGSHALLPSCTTCAPNYCGPNGASKPGCLGCQCAPNWGGATCTQCNWECAHGGQHINCADCRCDYPWDGDHCENCVRVCQNGGTLNAATCSCRCPAGFTGSNCENCDTTSYCKRGGQMVIGADPLDGSLTCTCNCPVSIYWGGPDCNTCVVNCGAGTRDTANGKCECDCPAHLDGTLCNQCNTNFCKNGAAQGTFPSGCGTCTCTGLWVGTKCDDCVLDNSGTGPRCATGSPNDICTRCICPTRTSSTSGITYALTEGIYCNSCNDNMCVNGVIDETTFPDCRCNCDPGFEGRICDRCISTLCSNGGTPKDATCSSCNCVGNWVGNYCDQCQLQCTNGGVRNDATCQCECDGFWRGNVCEICDNGNDPSVCDECSYNGVLNEDCTLCICDEYHTGEICEDCLYDCNGRGTRSEDCRTCECVGGWIAATNCTVCDETASSVYCNGRGTIVNAEDGCNICTCENFWGTDDCSECTIDCNGNGRPNDDCTACICENDWSEVDNCFTCDLDCNENGVTNDDCTRCICDGGYTGRLCDFCDAANYVPRCVYDDGTLTPDCECDCVDQWTGRYCNECDLSALNCANGDIIDSEINGEPQCRCRCYNNWIGDQCDYCGFLDVGNPLFQCPDISVPVLTDCSCHCPEYYADIEGCDICLITNEDCVHEDPTTVPDLRKGECKCICLGNWSGRNCSICDPQLVICEEGWSLNTENCECEPVCGDELIVGYEECEIKLMEDVDAVCCEDCYFQENRICDDLRTCTRYDFCEVKGTEIKCEGTDKLDYTVNADRVDIPLGPLTENHWSKWGITVTSSSAITVVDTRTLGYPSTNPCGGDIVFDRVLVATNNEQNAQLCFNMAEPIEVQSISVINNSKEPGSSSSFRIDFYCANTISPITVDARNYGPGSVEFIRNPCTGFLVTKICYRNFPTGAIGPVFFCDDNNYNLGRLGDYVWYDISVDNIQDANELPVPGVPVKLYEGTFNRYLAITYTNDQGLYIFEYLYNGNYSVEFNAPNGYTYSTPVRFPYTNMLHYGALDNNYITDTVKEILTVDVGIYMFGAIGDYIFYDVSEDGIQNEAASFAVSGVRLDLFRDDDLTTVIATKVTDQVGNYLFYPLPVYETATTYHSYVVRMTPPPSSTVTLRFSGSDRSADSNFDRNTYWSDVVPLTPQRPFDLTVDGGIYYCCGSVGDRVWFDTKTTDGIQNPSEDDSGVPNVRVTLYRNGVAVGSQFTNATGYYLFTGLPLSGSYYVNFATVPGYVLTEKSKGTDREFDSDANPNGDTDTFYLTRERPDRRDIDAGLKAGCTVASECATDNRCLTAFCNTATNQCEYTQTVTCTPLSDPCVEPVCQPSTGLCLPVPKISVINIPCDDNNVCTRGDVCIGGSCKGTPLDGPGFVCNDNDVCTSGDHCVAGECEGTPCSENPDPCITTICDATGCKDVPSPGTPCNDNNLCTERDVCDATGRCGGTPKPCANNEYCKEYTCDPGTGQCKPTITPNVPCSDGSPCTEADTCDDRGRCVGVPKECTGPNPCLNYFCFGGECTTSVKSSSTPCNDGNSCTEGDRCQPDATCAGTPKNCDDRKVCTTDVCTAGVCVHTVDTDATCTDGNSCTTDVCDALSGNCISTPIVCNDGKPCTDDACVNGQCVYTPSGRSCNDNNLCTIFDVCDPEGNCKGTTKNCDDRNICTDDTCDEATGRCVHTNNFLPCDDGTECSGRSYCTDGACVGYDIVQCTTSNPCSQIECDGVTGSCIESSKPDGEVCETNDRCRLSGVCQSGECQGRETVCNDNNPCTIDSCSSVTGECVFTHSAQTDNVPCNDGNKCTERDVCIYDAGFNLSRCYGTAIECDDGNICTIDYCDIFTGECEVENVDSTVTCDDNNKCTEGDYCIEGECRGSDVLCAPAGVCKESACSPVTGECEITITEGESCDDGIVCTGDDVCDAEGNCVGERLCEGLVHPNPCKDYLCSDTGDCIIIDIADNSPCDDGNACTQADVCILGRCTGTDPFLCESDACNRRECVDNNGVPTCSTTFTQNTCRPSVGCNDYICSAGTCTTVVNRNCNAGNTNPCTRRFCAADGTCSEENITGPCEDGNACTDNECRNGACVVTRTITPCGNQCTTDSECPDADNCFHYECVNNQCRLAADSCTPSTNQCIAVECDRTTGECRPRKLVNTRCNDDNRCTSNDVCVSTGTGAEDIECRGSDIPCPDRLCQVGTCNPDNGECRYRVTEGETCDDNVACTENDICDPEANCRGTPISCDDGNTCTDDVCVNGQCVRTDNERVCNDGNACTSNDRCLAGVCAGRTETTCPDSTDPCKRFECDIIRGCIAIPVEDGVVCGESDSFCAGGDSVCRGGVCVPPERTVCPDPIDPECPLICIEDQCVVQENACNDDDPCTVQDRCRANGQCAGVPLDCSALDDGCVEGVCFEGACVERPVRGATVCDDGDECTINRCEDGECKSTPRVCTSNNPCEQFTCEPDRGCVATNNPVSCTPVDGVANLCMDYICVDRACRAVPPTTACDDNNPCTNDQCFPATGECVHTPNDNLLCGDNDPCTVDRCEAGVCRSSPLICNDDNVCTDDVCVGGVCVSNPNTNTCPYSSGCITGGICSNKQCIPGTFAPCSTTETCKEAVCDRVTGACVVTDKTDGISTCDDGDDCTIGDVCTPLGCIGTPKGCPLSLVECQESYCFEGNCLLRPNDDLVCTSQDTSCATSYCENGTCVRDEEGTRDCSDDDPCTYGNECTEDGCTSKAYSCILSPCVYNECTNDGFCTFRDNVTTWGPLTYLAFQTIPADPLSTEGPKYYLVAISSITGELRGFARLADRILSLQVKPYEGGLFAVLANGRFADLYNVPVNVTAPNVFRDGVLFGWPLVTTIGTQNNPLDIPDLSFRPTFVSTTRPHTYDLWARSVASRKIFSLNTATNPAGQTLEYGDYFQDWAGYTWDNHGRYIYGATDTRELALFAVEEFNPAPYSDIPVYGLCDGAQVIPEGNFVDMFTRYDESIVGATDDRVNNKVNLFAVRFFTDENGDAKCLTTNNAINKTAFVTRDAPEEILEVIAVAFDDTICLIGTGGPLSGGGNSTTGGSNSGSNNGGGTSPGPPPIGPPPPEVVHYQGGSIPGSHTPGTTDNGVLTGGTGSVATAVVSVVGSSAVAAFAIFAVVLGLNNTKKDPPPNLTAALVGTEASAIASDNPLFQGMSEAGTNILA